jgi:hypothetical protein
VCLPGWLTAQIRKIAPRTKYDVRKSVQPTSKERVDWKKPDIRNQQGDKQTLEITAIKENARFHDEPFSRGKRKRLKFWHEDGYR